MFVCASLAKSLWCKLSPPHITLFEPTADFQWLITRHCSTFTPLTETTCTLLYWFCHWMLSDPSPYLDHLKSPCPEEMACAPWLMKNGLESLSVPLRQKSIYETLCLCTTLFFWTSPEKSVFLPLPHCTVLSISVLQWAQEAFTFLHLVLLFHKDMPFGRWRSHWRHVLLHPPHHPLRSCYEE